MPPQAADPRAAFATPVEALWLEVGFGGGEQALAQVAANPGRRPDRLRGVRERAVLPAVRGWCRRAGRPRRRCRPTCASGRRMRGTCWRLLPEAALDRLFLMFPDPWPKARHAKRRFVHPAMLPVVARVLRPGGEWRIATRRPDLPGLGARRSSPDRRCSTLPPPATSAPTAGPARATRPRPCARAGSRSTGRATSLSGRCRPASPLPVPAPGPALGVPARVDRRFGGHCWRSRRLLLGALLFLSVTRRRRRLARPITASTRWRAGSRGLRCRAGETEALWRVEDEAGARSGTGRPPTRTARCGCRGAAGSGCCVGARRRADAGRERRRPWAGASPRASSSSSPASRRRSSFFWSGDPAVGAVPAGPGDPPLPPVAAWLQGVRRPARPGCGADGTAWSVPGDALGGRVLLAELARRLGAGAARRWPTAPGAARALRSWPTRIRRAGRRLRRVARAAAPVSAAVVLAHGTTDTVPRHAAGALPRGARRGSSTSCAPGRRGRATPPVLLAPLPPADGARRGCWGADRSPRGSCRWKARRAWMLRMGIASSGPLPAPGRGLGPRRSARRRPGPLPSSACCRAATWRR